MRLKFRFQLASAFAVLLLIPTSVYGQGAILSASGPVNRSMGGAAVAAPVDAIGACYWNPATISGLARSETAFALDLLMPNQTVASSLGPFSGSTDAEPGVFPLPNIGWVHKSENEQLTYGLGIHSVAGFGTSMSVDPSNPVLAPIPAGGLGQVNSNALFLQIAPIVSYAATEQLSIAVDSMKEGTTSRK